MTLKASVEGQANGFQRQDWIRDVLNGRLGWSLVESRQLLKNSRCGNINFQEKIVGDLVELDHDVSIEVLTSEKPSQNVLWKKSKYIHSTARWQCFVYDLSYTKQLLPLFIRTDELKYILGPIDDVRWERYDSDSTVALWHQFLRDAGAKTIDEFIAFYDK
jgi:hypothetical protein